MVGILIFAGGTATFAISAASTALQRNSPPKDCEYAALTCEPDIPPIIEDRALSRASPDIALDMNAFAAS